MEKGGKRAVIVWHRRAGKDLFGINWTVRAMVQRPGLYWHLLPTYRQGRKVIWNGFTGEGRRFVDFFPPQLIKRRRDDEMLTEFFPIGDNMAGPIHQVVGSDDIDRLVGSNPVGVVLSEYSLQNPAAWNLIRPILAENGGWAMFIYTARGPNHGYDLFKSAQANPEWFAQKLTVDDTFKKVFDIEGNLVLGADGKAKKVHVVTPEMVDDDRKSGMPEELIQQEYYNSFKAPQIGSYYGDQMAKVEKEGRIREIPWEPRLKVHTAWDLGATDMTAIWFFQVNKEWIHVLDYYEANNKGMEHFAKILNERDYAYGTHLAPHDVRQKIQGATVSTRLKIAKDLGIKFSVVPKGVKREDGIMGVRAILPKCIFNQQKTAVGRDCLTQYQREWDEKEKVFKKTPKHDWASNGADAFRYLAVGLKHVMNTSLRNTTNQRTAITSYDHIKYGQQTAASEYDIFKKKRL